MTVLATPLALRDVMPYSDLTRRSLLTGAMAAAGLIVAGCSAGATDDSQQMVEVNDVFGPVQVPADAKRVVVLEDQTLGALLALGFPQERIVGWARGEVALSNYAYLEHLADLSAIENLGGEFDNPNIEAIVAAKPDLILFVAVAGDDFYTPIMDKLKETGIPVFAAFNGYLSVDEFYRLMTDVGVAVRQETKAEQIVSDFQARLADVKSRIQAAGETGTAAFVRVSPWGGSTANTLMPLLDALEIPGERPDAETFSSEVAPENLSQFNHDVLFIGDGQDQAKARAALEANPLWAQLPAVQSGRVYWVSDLTWGSGYSMPAVDSMLTDIERAYLG